MRTNQNEPSRHDRPYLQSCAARSAFFLCSQRFEESFWGLEELPGEIAAKERRGKLQLRGSVFVDCESCAKCFMLPECVPPGLWET